MYVNLEVAMQKNTTIIKLEKIQVTEMIQKSLLTQ